MVLGYVVVPRLKYDRTRIKRIEDFIGHTQTIATIALLFSIGMWVGSNEEFWNDIGATGIAGVLFTLLTVAGSVIVMGILARIFIRRKGKSMP